MSIDQDFYQASSLVLIYTVGTAAVAVAGLFASTRVTKMRLSEYTFLFQGAGSVSYIVITVYRFS